MAKQTTLQKLANNVVSKNERTAGLWALAAGAVLILTLGIFIGWACARAWGV